MVREGSSCLGDVAKLTVFLAIKELVADANFECNEEGIVRAQQVGAVATVDAPLNRTYRRWTTLTSRSSRSN